MRSRVVDQPQLAHDPQRAATSPSAGRRLRELAAIAIINRFRTRPAVMGFHSVGNPRNNQREVNDPRGPRCKSGFRYVAR
jgi:hypothetical protein